MVKRCDDAFVSKMDTMNEWCNYCGIRLRRRSKRIAAAKMKKTMVIGLLTPVRLRRSTRHNWCVRCDCNGERSSHAFCGVCGDKLVAAGAF
jgi:hypothetical protein